MQRQKNIRDAHRRFNAEEAVREARNPAPKNATQKSTVQKERFVRRNCESGHGVLTIGLASTGLCDSTRARRTSERQGTAWTLWAVC